MYNCGNHIGDGYWIFGGIHQNINSIEVVVEYINDGMLLPLNNM